MSSIAEILATCPPGTIIYGESYATYPFWANRKEAMSQSELEQLASECLLKQANTKWGAAAILLEYLHKAYQLGLRAARPKFEEEGGS